MFAYALFLIIASTALLLLTGGLFYLLFWMRPARWSRWRLPVQRGSTARPWHEAFLSAANLMIYAYPFLIAAAVETYLGYTVRYANISDYGWAYFFFSIALFLLIVDADFYWTHRFLHRRLKFAHAVHHQFTNPTPWCGFAFHALESVLLALPYVPLLLLIPWHPATIVIVQFTAMIWNAFLHLGYDMPQAWKSRWPLRFLMTARDHCGHHANPRSNFGLYFNYWDRLCGTR